MIPSMQLVHKVSLGLLAGVALLTVVAFRHPPLLGSDFSAMCDSWDHFRRTGEFNRAANPDPDNIALDRSSFMTWWSPGPQIATGVFEFAGLPIGWGIIFWSSAGMLAELWGYRRLYAALGFDSSTVAWTLVGIAAGWHTLYTFRQFQGGDPFIGALLPWTCIALLYVRRSAWHAFLTIAALTLAGAYLKLSFLIAGIGLAAALGASALFDVYPEKCRGRRALWQVAALALGIMLAWGVLHWSFLSRGPTPATPYAENVTLRGCAHAAAIAFVLPFCSTFGFVSVLGALCDFCGWRHLENNAALLCGAVAACAFAYILLWKATPRGQARMLLVGFGLTYFFAFTGLYSMHAAVSYEDRHFRPLGLFLLPALVAVATRPQLGKLRFGFAAVVAIGGAWGVGSYGFRLTELIQHDDRSMRRYSLRNLPSETERYLAGIDAYLKSGNNLFVSDEPEALLSVRHNRVGRCNGGPLRGRVDTLVVILPPQTDPRPKLASFVDYRATCWNSCNVHGWVIWWQGRDDLGKLPTREASDRSLPTPKQS